MPPPPTKNEEAIALVRLYCGWHVAPEQDDTLVMDGPGASTLILPSLHVVDLTAITEDGVLLDPTAYSWSSAGIVRRGDTSWWMTSPYWRGCGPRWTANLRGLEVELTHGYTDWPPEVMGVIERLTARANADDTVLAQVGGVRYATDADGMPVSGASVTDVDRHILDAYRLPELP